MRESERGREKVREKTAKTQRGGYLENTIATGAVFHDVFQLYFRAGLAEKRECGEFPPATEDE